MQIADTQHHLTRSIGTAVAVFSLAAALPAQSPPKITPVDAAGLKQAVKARKGKVVMVNFWATWCIPCVKEFPDLVRVYKKHRARGLDLVTVSFDEVKDTKPKVAPFLTKQKHTSGAYILKSSPDEFAERFDAKWQGEIPRTYIYGRDGRLVKVLVGEQSAAALEKTLAPLLARK